LEKNGQVETLRVADLTTLVDMVFGKGKGNFNDYTKFVVRVTTCVIVDVSWFVHREIEV